MIHDIEPKHLYNEWKPNAVPKRSSAVVQFCGRNLLCRIDDNGLKLPSRAMFPDGDERFTYLFELDGREYYLLRDETPRGPDGWTYRDINIFRTEQPKEIAFAAVSAWHLCCWYRDTRFCGRCGTPLEHDVNERMMHCPRCGNMIFPRINPSVIVAVTHGDYLLLTQYANRPGATRTALIAGFTEFGETAEQTVHREVMEEVGLKVKNLRYYKSQPWGISGGGLLLGYWCELDGDETIHLDNFELADGAWVSREELRRDYRDNGVALTSEMIARFAVGESTSRCRNKMKKRGAEGSALSLCKGCSDPFPEQLQKEKVRGIENVKEIFSAAPPAFAAVEQQERCAQQHPRRGDEQREQSREPPYARRAQQIEKRGGERAEKDVFAADGKRRRAEDETGQDVQRYPLPALCRVGLNACEHE